MGLTMRASVAPHRSKRERVPMPSAARLSLREEDVVRLALEFLHNRELHIAQLSLERESGVINGGYSDDVLFLRQLVLDGQWDDALEFVQPLEQLAAFDARRFRFAVLKHKYTELLCIKAEASALGTSVDNAVEEVVKVLGELEKCAPSKEEYSTMCLLLTLPRLTDHLHYKDWNPSNARVQCFREIYSLVAEFLPGDRKCTDEGHYSSAKNDRLIQLIIKGVLYEFCVNFCQAKATGAAEPQCQEIVFGRLLAGGDGFGDADLSLLSWLQSVPPETFSVPFEQRSLRVDVERLERPSLETSWTEHILVTPIKPKTFPHSAMPFTRPRSAADLMSRSLMPALEGAGRGAGPAAGAYGTPPRAMAASTGDILANGPMTRSSFASFHLTGMKSNKLMNTSVDRLFENDQVFLSNSYADFQQLPSIQEQTSTPKININYNSNSASLEDKLSTSSLDNKGRESPASTVTLRPQLESPSILTTSMDQTFSGELVKEFQKTKQKMQDALAIREREREEILRQINSENYRTPEIQKIPTRVIEEVPTAVEHDDKHDDSGDGRPRFVAVASLEDVQAVRCADFHPSGQIYAVGSNSKTLRICAYPKVSELRENHQTYQPTVLFKRTKHHKGSIYCLAWSPVGDLLATGSNDKTVKLMKFNVDTSNIEGDEIELGMHDGTVRDVCFLEDSSNKSSLLISGGAGDCKIYVTDCATGTPFQALSGHTGHVLSLYTWGGAMFASGSHDKTVRFWDLRAKGCVNVVAPVTAPGSRAGSPVAALCVDPSGRLLVSGHEDGACVLFDIRGGRGVQGFQPHAADVRSVRFSPSAYYLLSAGYDNKLVLTDLQGDLTLPLPSVVVAQHEDKAISARWHPSEFSFVSTSADKTATLWALPPV